MNPTVSMDQLPISNVTSFPPISEPIPEMIFRTSMASIPAMADTAAPTAGIGPSGSFTVPIMSLSEGVFPGMHTAI